MLVSTKKTKSFVIENKGEFDFRYSIQKLVRSTSPSADRFGKGRKKVQSSRDGSASSKTDMGGKTEGKAFKGTGSVSKLLKLNNKIRKIFYYLNFLFYIFSVIYPMLKEWPQGSLRSQGSGNNFSRIRLDYFTDLLLFTPDLVPYSLVKLLQLG